MSSFGGKADIAPSWRNFGEARNYVRSLKFSGVGDYKKWTGGKLKNKPTFPDDIPAWPPDIYENVGWKGFSDFLGSKPSAKYVQMWPFPKARRFVRKLELTSPTEYSKWAGGALSDLPTRPAEVPVVPFKKYSNQWRGWDDWLGRR